jgi:hypothetical protein
MGGRGDGKTPYKKNPKKEKKELDDDDKAFQEKQKEEARKLKEMQAKAGQQKGFIGGGISRSGKK